MKNPSKTTGSKVVEIKNRNAAGIDIGSTEVYVCVPSDRDQEPIRCFGTFTDDLYRLARWLRTCRIDTVAIEATGVYWIPTYEILESEGIAVHLVNTRSLKRQKKTDVCDSEWLQQMHTYGMLPASFRPSESVCMIRSLVRQRENLLRQRAAHIQQMQKALHQMNLQIDNVISDITGDTGMAILRAIVSGNHDPAQLSKYRDPRCKSSEETIRKSLIGNYKREHLFALKQNLELYEFYTAKLQECDHETESIYQEIQREEGRNGQISHPRKIKRRKSDPAHDLQTALYRTFGVDLTAVPGISVVTAQVVLSEIGPDLSQFASCKRFTSWAALSPNNRTSGGKIITSRPQKRSHRVRTALHLAARGLRLSQNALGAYFRKVQAAQGTPAAIAATAHKLARIIYCMITRGIPYDETLQKQIFDDHYKERAIKSLQIRAKRLGFQLVAPTTEVS